MSTAYCLACPELQLKCEVASLRFSSQVLEFDIDPEKTGRFLHLTAGNLLVFGDGEHGRFEDYDWFESE